MMTSTTKTTKLQRLAEKLSAMTDLKEDSHRRGSHVVSLPIKPDPRWESMRDYISRSVPELQGSGSADLMRSVYIALSPCQNPEILKSLAALSLPNSHEASTKYDDHILTLAQCFSTPSPILRRSSKLAVLRTLITMRSPLEAGWQLQEVVLEDTLKFITTRSQNWPFANESHCDEVLLWELRATTLNEIESRSERVAGYISKQAVRVERGLELSTTVVNAGIEGAGAKLRELLEPEQTPLVLEANQSILDYSEKAKLATDSVRLTSRQALVQFQSTSARGIHSIANRINEGGVESVIPSEDGRRALCAVGKVGIASVGAAALVADTLIESTGQVAKKTASVAADVVEHKYGSQAGILVRNASDTAGNIARTLSHVALFHKGRAMTKSVARVTGKAHFLHINEKCLLDDFVSDSSLSDESDMFAEATGDMFHDEVADAGDEELVSEEVSQHQEPISSEPVPQREIFVLGEDSLSAFDFGASINLSPSELDSCLPDQIKSAEAHSDFFSDITTEPVYERNRSYFKQLNLVHSARSSIFRNVHDARELDFLRSSGGDETCRMPTKRHSDDDSLDCTACTMEETYLTYGASECQALEEGFDLNDSASHVSGFEKHYETWGTGSEVSSAPPHETNTRIYQANGIPPNGYAEVEAQGSPRGLYSSVKSKLGIQS